jgi:hypothetical protein
MRTGAVAVTVATLGHANAFDDCVLKNMQDVTSDVAAKSIKAAAAQHEVWCVGAIATRSSHRGADGRQRMQSRWCNHVRRRDVLPLYRFRYATGCQDRCAG